MNDRLPVDAAPVIEHVRALKRKGMPLGLISREAGVQVNKFYLGYYVDEKLQRHEVLRCRQGTRDAILAVQYRHDDIGEGFSGELIKRARLAAGVSLTGLARLTGMDPNTVRRWERNANFPRYRRQVEKVANALGVPYEAFFAPAEPVEDAYTEEFQRRPAGEDDFIMSGYPCGVCGKEFKSRIKLATHTHERSYRR